MTLWLKSEEVAPLVDMAKAIEVTEAAFREQGQGFSVEHGPFALGMQPEKAGETVGPLLDQRLRVVSGGLLGSEKVSLRMGPRHGDSIAVLYDCSGELLSVMGYPFGTLRTGATIGVAVKQMAREDSEHVGIIGTGRNALSLLIAVQTVRPMKDVRVYSRNEQNRQQFSKEASEALGLPVQPMSEPRDVFIGSDIVLTATNSREPVFDADWIEPGTHVSSMGPITELSPQAFGKADRIAVGTIGQERTNYYDPRGPHVLDDAVAAGLIAWHDVVQLGDLISEKVKWDLGADDTTLFHESQGGFGDTALIAAAYAEALRRGIGETVAI